MRFPAKGTVYDYYVNFRASKFSPWADLVQPVDFDGSVPMSQVPCMAGRGRDGVRSVNGSP